MRSVRDNNVLSGATMRPASVRGALGTEHNKRQCLSLRALVYFGLILTLANSFPAVAEPRSIEDCEKIQAADAYNQCLASFGPVAHEHGVKADPEGATAGHSGEGDGSIASARGRHGSHHTYARSYRHQRQSSQHNDPWANIRHTGRQRAEFRIR